MEQRNEASVKRILWEACGIRSLWTGKKTRREGGGSGALLWSGTQGGKSFTTTSSITVWILETLGVFRRIFPSENNPLLFADKDAMQSLELIDNIHRKRFLSRGSEELIILKSDYENCGKCRIWLGRGWCKTDGMRELMQDRRIVAAGQKTGGSESQIRTGDQRIMIPLL